jgi:MraZ protein
MSDQQATQPMFYNSRYRHGVDGQRRVQIPAKWRSEKNGDALTMAVWPSDELGTCLRVVPSKKMFDLLAEIDAMPRGDAERSRLRRIIGSESVQISLDQSGRVSLPEEMARAAGIKDEAMFVGLLDRFEIWNPARYEKVRAAEEAYKSEALKKLD